MDNNLRNNDKMLKNATENEKVMDKKYCIDNNLCYHCYKPGHVAQNCNQGYGGSTSSKGVSGNCGICFAFIYTS